MDREPFIIPVDRGTVAHMVAHWPDKLIAWQLPNDLVGLLGADGKTVSAIADVYWHETSAVYRSGEETRIRLTTQQVWAETFRPVVLRAGYPVVEVTLKETE